MGGGNMDLDEDSIAQATSGTPILITNFVCRKIKEVIEIFNKYV